MKRPEKTLAGGLRRCVISAIVTWTALVVGLLTKDILEIKGRFPLLHFFILSFFCCFRVFVINKQQPRVGTR